MYILAQNLLKKSGEKLENPQVPGEIPHVEWKAVGSKHQTAPRPSQIGNDDHRSQCPGTPTPVIKL